MEDLGHLCPRAAQAQTRGRGSLAEQVRNVCRSGPPRSSPLPWTNMVLRTRPVSEQLSEPQTPGHPWGTRPWMPTSLQIPVVSRRTRSTGSLGPVPQDPSWPVLVPPPPSDPSPSA